MMYQSSAYDDMQSEYDSPFSPMESAQGCLGVILAMPVAIVLVVVALILEVFRSIKRWILNRK